MSVMKAALESPDLLVAHTVELRASLRLQNPTVLADLTGFHYQETAQGEGAFHFLFWGRKTAVSFPSLIAHNENGKPLGTLDQAMLAYYFNTADGAPPTGRWVGFSELLNGRFYTQAFQGYTSQKLAQTFGDDAERFAQAAEQLHGTPEPLGNRAYSFAILPRVSLLAVCWLGDDDFATSYRILFDTAVSHHLPTDGCAILGSILTRRLIAHL